MAIDFIDALDISLNDQQLSQSIEVISNKSIDINHRYIIVHIHTLHCTYTFQY